MTKIHRDRTMEVTVRIPVMSDEYNTDKECTADAIYSMLNGNRASKFFPESEVSVMSIEELDEDDPVIP